MRMSYFSFLRSAAVFGTLFCLGLGIVVAAAEDPVRIRVEPRVLSEGMDGAFTITTNGAVPRIAFPPKPEGLRISWNAPRTARQESVVNGVHTSSLTHSYPLVALKAGEWTIPSFDVVLDGKTVKTEPLTVTVRKTADIKNAAAAKNQPAFLMLELPERKAADPCYVGEEIALSALLYVRAPLAISFRSEPEFVTAGGVAVRMRDFRNVNPDLPMFESYTANPVTVDGSRFTLYRFESRFRALAAGKLSLTVRFPVAFQDQSSIFGRAVGSQTVSASLPEMTVRRLPHAPSDVPYCGLIGSWRISAVLSPEPYAVAEPVTLQLRFAGKGNSETLLAPKFEFPGFRAYPPETEKSASGTTIRYTLIPTAEGDHRISFGLSSFDPARGEYVPFRFDRVLTIGKANTLLTATHPGPVIAGPPDATEEPGGPGPQKPHGVLYLSTRLGDGPALPLSAKAWTIAVGLFFLGFCFFFGAILVMGRKRLMASNPALTRRMGARARKRAILQQVKSSSPDDLSGEVADRIGEYLNDLYDLPPGTSLSETADYIRLKQPDLADPVAELAQATWSPGMKRVFDEAFKSRLLRALSRFTVFAFVLFAPHVIGSDEAVPMVLGDGNTQRPLLLPQSPEAAMTAYDTGDFSSALAYYKSILNPDRPSPGILYNIGNCYYQMGDYPRALVSYERAHRLSPRNSDIQENLNLTRRKLSLEEKFTKNTPSDLVVSFRDSFRVDEWILGGAVLVLLVFVILGLRVFIPQFRRSWLLSIGTLVFALFCFGLALWQYQTTYSDSNAVVIQRNTPLYSLPSVQSGTVGAHLKAGSEIVIEEVRHDWLRVRFGQEQGWIPSSAAARLWEDSCVGI